MIAHIIFDDGDEDIFPIERFDYSIATKNGIFHSLSKKTNELVPMALRRPANVYLYLDNGTPFRNYKLDAQVTEEPPKG